MTPAGPAFEPSIGSGGGVPAFAGRMDLAIERALGERRIVGAVVLAARDGEIIYHRAAGFADREAGTGMREDAIFRLASISKPFVTAAAMRLAERGVIALHEPVTTYLPDFRPALADGTRPVITLRQLVTHTAGLGYRFQEPGHGPYHDLDVSDGLDQPGLSIADNLARLRQAPLLFAPGDQWRYSLGIDVLGAVLERAAGETLDAIVRDEITAPLGLNDTGFAVVPGRELPSACQKEDRAQSGCSPR
jgi:CubicO group peptidase (beta-lactamase class C family)